MPCKEIENNLPAYLEDALSPREKAVVEKHLASCAQCSKALQDLKKTDKLVREMEEMEPPPWFTQKIMSRVREEAKKKDTIFRKFFYPLHIKIPIQALATVLIAVIAFQIYKFGELEMKVSESPPASVLKAEKEQAPAAAQKTAETAPSRAKEELYKKGAPKDMRVADAPSTALSRAPRQAEEVRIQKEDAPPAEMPASDAEKKESLSGKDEEIIGRPAPVKHQKVAKSLSAPVPEYKDEGPGYHADAVRKSKEQYAAPATPQLLGAAVSRTDRIGVVVHVGDAGVAAEEVEKILSKYDARNTRKQFREDITILTTELKAENTAEFLQKLKTVGKIEQKGVLPDVRGQYISITIELSK